MSSDGVFNLPCYRILSILFSSFPLSDAKSKSNRGEIEHWLRLNPLTANEMGTKVLFRQFQDASTARIIQLALIENTITKSSPTKLEAWELSDVHRVGSVLSPKTSCEYTACT